MKALVREARALGPEGAHPPLVSSALFGLIASTGLRISEALNLRLEDVTSEGLVVRHTKFGKSRLLPLHWTTRNALDHYLERRPAVGTVQLDLSMRANGRHRAEVLRLLVHRRARRGGIGRALMLAIEAEARRRGRTTLVLDTRQGDPSEVLYRSLGWQLAGVIPRYARSGNGALDASAFYYKLLST